MIILNGGPFELAAGESLEVALAHLGLAPEARGVAVAVDGVVVPRSQWPLTVPPDGARVEVLSAMQGG